MKKNQFKAAIQANQTTYGVWNGLPDTYVAEILAGAGFDWVLIDGEHAPFDLRTILAQMQAINQFETSIIVRPPVGDVHLIKQLLEIGVQNLLVPMVETAEQAQTLYQAMQYPPVGVRGVGAALSRGAQWTRTADYFKNAGAEMCLIVQVESVLGIQNLDEILKTQGVDGVFIGPADLAASMGFIGQPNHPEVKTVILKALKMIRAAHKTAGILSINKALADEYTAAGANMLGVGVDTLLLAKATRELADLYKK